MEIRTIYIANDGTKFDSEDECMNYEFKKRWKGLNERPDIVFYDDDGKAQEVNGPEDYDQLIAYIWVGSKGAYDELWTICFKEGITSPDISFPYDYYDDFPMLFYRSTSDDWIVMTSMLEALRAINENTPL